MTQAQNLSIPAPLTKLNSGVTSGPEPATARKWRPLPAQWTHRTAQRVYTDSARGSKSSASENDSTALGPVEQQQATVRVHRQSSLHVLWVLTRTEFRARYRSQALGLLWSLLNPLVMRGIISLVFTHLVRSQEKHFPVFLLMGLLLWQWVTGAITAVTTVFLGNADIIKRTIF